MNQFYLFFALAALCNASNRDPNIEKVQAHFDGLNAILISVDKGFWKTTMANARVDILFERKDSSHDFKLVDWRAKTDWSKWSNPRGGVALIRVSELKAYDKMTVVVKVGDETVLTKSFLPEQLLPKVKLLPDVVIPK